MTRSYRLTTQEDSPTLYLHNCKIAVLKRSLNKHVTIHVHFYTTLHS